MPSTRAAAARMADRSVSEYEHLRSRGLAMYSGGQRDTMHRQQAEAYEYNQISKNLISAHAYIPAPVCCSECEKFWRALILEIDEKHTSKLPEGKASMRLVKGTAGSELHIKTPKHATTERRFFPGLGCINATVQEDSLTSIVGSIFNLCRPCPSATEKISSCSTLTKRGRCHELSKTKLNIATIWRDRAVPVYSDSSNGRQFVFQPSGRLGPQQEGFNGTEAVTDMRSTPYRDGGERMCPESPVSSPSSCVPNPAQLSMPTMISAPSQLHVKGDREDANQGLKHARKYFKPIHSRFHGNGQMEEAFSDPSSPPQDAPINNGDFQSIRLKPFPPMFSSSHAHGLSRDQRRRTFSHQTTPRKICLSPIERSLSQSPPASGFQKIASDGFESRNFPQTTLQTSISRWRRDARNLQEVQQKLTSLSADHPSSRTCHIHGVDVVASKHGPSHRDRFLNSTPPSNHSTHEANHDDIQGLSSETKLSPASTTDSGYTSLSFTTSNHSSSTSSCRGEANRGSRTSSPESKTNVLNYARFKASDQTSSADDTEVDLCLPTSTWKVKIPHRSDNTSCTSKSPPAVLTPIVLFTGYGCRSETDDDWDEDFDDAIANPESFRGIVSNATRRYYVPEP